MNGTSETSAVHGRTNSVDQKDLVLKNIYIQSEVERSLADLFDQLSGAQLDKKDERSKSSSSY